MNVTVCLTCNNEFSHYGKRKYCGLKCVPVNVANAARWKGKTPVILNCAICGIEFSVRPSRVLLQNTKYCSYSCHQIGEGRKGGAVTAIKKSEIAEAQLGGRKSYPKKNNRHLHRIVAEEKLGRPLALGEIVHHIDENKQNPDPDNLEVLPSQSEHARLHMQHRRRKS